MDSLEIMYSWVQCAYEFLLFPSWKLNSSMFIFKILFAEYDKSKPTIKRHISILLFQLLEFFLTIFVTYTINAVTWFMIDLLSMLTNTQTKKW